MPGSFFSNIVDPHDVITPIPSGTAFPELIASKKSKYNDAILLFQTLISESDSSGELLRKIREDNYDKDTRMSLLKMFRRCVCLVCDTEATKKIKKIPTQAFIDNYGHTFKSIKKLKTQFAKTNDEMIATLSVLLGEYDNRGEQGYILTDLFFTWFEETFPDLKIIGPRGAGQDIELSSVLHEFTDSYPCDFVILDATDNVLAVGFARYDSTRGGAQSDDRTGGNSDKVSKAKHFYEQHGKLFRLIFLSDGPGLAHKDTWEESCKLDSKWDDNVRVTTLSLAPERVEREWIENKS